MSEDAILQKLDAILTQLDRMEKRQLKLKEEVDDIEQHEAPIMGSFATVDSGKKKED
jgi:hypothetical protein